MNDRLVRDAGRVQSESCHDVMPWDCKDRPERRLVKAIGYHLVYGSALRMSQ